jgi:hypothetical protein
LEPAIPLWRRRGWRPGGRRGVGGVSNWTLLAVASLLLVLPTCLSILYAPQTAVPNGLAYSEETIPLVYPKACVLLPLDCPPIGYTDYLNVLFSVSFGSARPNLTLHDGWAAYAFGYISELGGGNYTFSFSCWPSGPCSPWVTPDRIAGVSLDPVTLEVRVLVIASELPGTPCYVGPTLFIAGAVGLVACAAFVVVRFRRRWRQRTPPAVRDPTSHGLRRTASPDLGETRPPGGQC